MVLLLQTGSAAGRGAALATAAGLAVARASHVALAALGLAALLKASPLAFEAVRFCGAAYLVWLGIGILRAGSPVPGTATFSSRRDASCLRAFRRGLLTNILNPKSLLFCSVLLPQFIRTGQENVADQFLLLGAILVGVGLAFDIAYATAGAALGRLGVRFPLVETTQRWAFSMILIGFGLRLALGT